MNPVIALCAITFFDDIDIAIDLPKMGRPLSIKNIKECIIDGVLRANKIFK